MADRALECFGHASRRIKEGAMMHCEFADYYDYLGLMGFKRMHEYSYYKEAAQLRGLHRYCINHLEMLVPKEQPQPKQVVPSPWYARPRSSVGRDAREQAVKTLAESWVEWETETKRLYEGYQSELLADGHAAAAEKMGELVEYVDKELKRASRMRLKLDACGYDMGAIVMMQDALHEKYRKKSHHESMGEC